MVLQDLRVLVEIQAKLDPLGLQGSLDKEDHQDWQGLVEQLAVLVPLVLLVHPVLWGHRAH